MQNSQHSQLAEVGHRRQTRRHCVQGFGGEGNAENDIKEKGKIEDGEQPKRRLEPVTFFSHPFFFALIFVVMIYHHQLI